MMIEYKFFSMKITYWISISSELNTTRIKRPTAMGSIRMFVVE